MPSVKGKPFKIVQLGAYGKTKAKMEIGPISPTTNSRSIKITQGSLVAKIVLSYKQQRRISREME